MLKVQQYGLSYSTLHGTVHWCGTVRSHVAVVAVAVAVIYPRGNLTSIVLTNQIAPAGNILSSVSTKGYGLSTNVSPANVGPTGSSYAYESHTDSETGHFYRFELLSFGVKLDGEPMLKFSCPCTAVWCNRESLSFVDPAFFGVIFFSRLAGN